MHITNKAQSENLYQTVYHLEGMRYPVESPEALDQAGGRIASQMRAHGLDVREQLFYIDGWKRPFRNIEGSLGPVGEKPAAVLTAHYDSAETPGANDDAAGIAVILEAARLLAQMDDPPPVYIVAVTLEEGENPLIHARIRESKIRLGVVDGQNRYTNWACGKMAAAIQKRAIQILNSGKTQAEGYLQALAEFGEAVPANLREHIEEIAPLYAQITVESAIGQRSRISSHRWVQEALQTGNRLLRTFWLGMPESCKPE
ncbi:MAG: M28 family peptidase [Chloroflexi bacterium]|nr:M28 family peptidase [Chloroflexota bacterium]